MIGRAPASTQLPVHAGFASALHLPASPYLMHGADFDRPTGWREIPSSSPLSHRDRGIGSDHRGTFLAAIFVGNDRLRWAPFLPDPAVGIAPQFDSASTAAPALSSMLIYLLWPLGAGVGGADGAVFRPAKSDELPFQRHAAPSTSPASCSRPAAASLYRAISGNIFVLTAVHPIASSLRLAAATSSILVMAA